MGFWKGLVKIAVGTVKVTGSAALGVSKLVGKGAVVAGKAVYDHREELGQAAVKTARVAGKVAAGTGKVIYAGVAATTKAVYDHRQEIADGVKKTAAVTSGAAVGATKAVGETIRNTSAHFTTSKEDVRKLVDKIQSQSAQYRQILDTAPAIARSKATRKALYLDTLVVGGNTLASYIDGPVPPDIEKAFSLQYPGLAENENFRDVVVRLNDDQLLGFVSGVKGKLFEIRYVDYLNDGHLPNGYQASLAGSATQPGWDIHVDGPDGHTLEVIQAKATDAVSYVKEALVRYPEIDVVTTSEVYSQLMMQGFSEQVIDSGISDADLTEMVEGATDGAIVHMSWMPSSLSMAIIAFSAYSQKDLNAYDKSKQFGQRAGKSYLAYLAGGALAVATHTWWIGVIGGMGSRFLMGSGSAKLRRFEALKELVKSNDKVLRRLRKQRRLLSSSAT